MKILFLDIDTLRPDHLGCYGYHRNTSPNIDRVASEGIRFSNYYCPDAPCLPSRTALVTGMFGIHSGSVGHCGTAADQRLDGSSRGFRSRLGGESLWKRINQCGIHTASISPFAERHSAWAFNAGFVETYNTGHCGGESAEEITPIALDWIERNADSREDWLLHVNYWDPHTPYRAPEEFGNPFENDPLPEWLTEEVLEGHQQCIGPHGVHEISMYGDGTDPKTPRQVGKIPDIAALRKHIDGYDCGIAYMDTHIGQLLDALEKKGVMDELVIIITSDHGENHGELGIYGEHGTADHTTCNIPMIIRWPGSQAASGTEDTGLHYNLDLGPTMMDMLGGEMGKTWDGQSYAQTLKTGQDTGRDHLVISQCAHVCQRSVRFGPWLYMRTYHDGFHLFDQEMLFNIDDDPHEQNNLAESKPDLCHQGAHILMDWHDDMMATQLDNYPTDPMRIVLAEGGPCHANGQLAEYCKFLEKTGRGWAIEELRKRHPREFTDES